MKYLLIKNEKGRYVKINSTERYDILECEYAIGPRADEFVEFASLQEALAFWNLEPVEPEVEDEL